MDQSKSFREQFDSIKESLRKEIRNPEIMEAKPIKHDNSHTAYAFTGGSGMDYQVNLIYDQTKS